MATAADEAPIREKFPYRAFLSPSNRFTFWCRTAAIVRGGATEQAEILGAVPDYAGSAGDIGPEDVAQLPLLTGGTDELVGG